MSVGSIAPRYFSTAYIQGTRRRRELALLVFAIVASIVLARLILTIGVGAVAALVVPVALIAIGLRPRLGVLLIFGIVLFFDGETLDPWMLPGRYINFSLQTTLNLSGAILIPIEMLVLMTAAVWLAQACMRRQVDFQAGSIGRLVLLFGVVLVLAVVRGLVSGANLNYAFWESRFLFGMVLMYVITANSIRTRAHVRTLIRFVFVFAGLSVLEGIWRKYALINAGLMGAAQENWYSHEDVVFWGMVLILVFAQAVFGGPRWQRILGPFLAIASVFVMLISERRAGLIAVMIAVALFTLSLVKINRKAFFLMAVPTAIAAAIYLPLFWNNPGTLGQAARAVRSISSSADARDAASNAWRDLEAVNVRATIASDPILGIGFGRPFLQVVTVPDISFFEFWDYEAHHNILWVWMKTGAVGFICFFSLLFSGIARSIWLAKTLRVPELRVFAILGSSAIVMSMVFCYVDIGIPLLMGVVLGAIGVLDRIQREEHATSPTQATARP
jgi:hypothetical protein